MKPRFFCLILSAAAAFISCSPAWAGLEYWKVAEVSGLCEIAETPASGWHPAETPFFLKKGASIRTGNDASVEIMLNRSLESVLHLSGNTQVDFLERSPQTLRLKKGSLFVLMEAPADALQLSTPHSEVSLTLGAAAIESGASGDTIRVFSESVQVQSRPVPEGLKVQVPAAGALPEAQRMVFSDYADWQRWIKKNYEQKDKTLGARS